LLAAELQERICECRRKTGWGPRLVAGATGFAHSTVWKVLKRAGLSRPPRALKEPANRYEWPCPGDLLHMDTSRYARFLRPGHAVTGDRSQSLRGRSTNTLVGYDFAHAIVDDRSRLAYVELHDDERAETVTGFVERALAFFAEHGIVAKRLMTDNGFSYVRNRSLRELLTRRGIRHLTTVPYRPRTNGKVERFHQTMGREWGYGLAYRSHRHRNAALPHWLDHYNRTRPHSSLGDRPPISRVHNVRG
jgi:transposase InsO family protein